MAVILGWACFVQLTFEERDRAGYAGDAFFDN
jgi:hypothetical protein